MKGISFAALLSICSTWLFAQSPAIDWQKTYGGNSTEGLFSIVETPDSNYLLGGYSSSGISGEKTDTCRGKEDYWIVKIDADGNKIWDKTYGGDSTDYLQKLIACTDGGYLLAGYSNSAIGKDRTAPAYGYWDTWLVKIDGDGNKLWDKSYAGSGRETDGIVSCKQTSDNGFLLWIVSSSDSNAVKDENSRGSADYWLIKTDSVGNIEWQKVIGGNSIDHILSVIETNDGGYALGGFTMSGAGNDKTTPNYGGFDYWVIKLDAARNIEWQKEYGGTAFDHLMSLEQLPDSGYIIGGFSQSGINGNKTVACRGLYDYWMIRTDVKGNLLWQKVIGGNKSEEMRGGIMPVKTGGYLMVGFSQSGISGDKSDSCRGMDDYWIVRTDSAGNKIWDKTIGGDSTEYIYTSIETHDHGFILAGWSASGISGDKTDYNRGGFDYWVVKVKPDALSVNDIVAADGNVRVYPNPFSGSTTIQLNLKNIPNINGLTLEITDVSGKLVKKFTGIVTDAIQVDGKLLRESGVYFYRLINKSGPVASGKLIFVKEK